MDIINESNKLNLSKPKTERTSYSNLINKKLNESCKSVIRKINLRKNINFNYKSQNSNSIKFPKISSLYSSISNKKQKLNISKLKSSFLSDINNISFKEKPIKNIKKGLSINFFQNNDIDFVRNLNPDSNQDLVSNFLLKERLKNKLDSQIDLFNYFNQKNNDYEDSEKNEEDNNDEYRNLENKLLKLSQSNLIEKELNYRLKEIRNKYNLKKKDKHEINNKFSQKLQEIDNIEYDIKLLEYKSKENSKLQSQLINSNSNDSIAIKKQMSFRSPKLKEMKNEFIRRKTILQEYLNSQKETEKEKKLKQNQILEIQKEIKGLKVPLNLLSNEISELKNNEKNTKVELLKYYLELLYVGKEVRSEGLVWIIKGIWKLGENVPISFMPKFLDFQAIKYLFTMAKISIELEFTKKYINQLKQRLKEKININPSQTSSKNLIKEELTLRKNMSNNNSIFKDNISIIKKLSETNRATKSKNRNSFFIFNKNNIFRKKLLYSPSSPDLMSDIMNRENNTSLNINQKEKEPELRSSISQLTKIFDLKNKSLYYDKMPEINEIHQLRKKIISLNKQLEEMKKNEIKRIFKEYIENDYEKSYRAPIEVVLGALIGEHARNVQMNNFNVYKKSHYDEIKTIRFFDYGKRNNYN